MKTGKWGKTILALLLAAMMILPSVAAMADPEPDLGGVKVEDGVAYALDSNTGAWVEIDIKLVGDLAVKTEKDTDALTIKSEEKDSSFEVTGDVRAVTETEGNSASSLSVHTYTEPDQTTEVEIGGDVAADADSNGYASAYGIDANNSGETTIHVAGDVEATASGTTSIYAQGIHATANNTDSPVVTNITVDGKVKASVEAAETEEGNDPKKQEFAVYADATSEGSETNVTIGKGAEGQVYAAAYDQGTVTITILDGGVTANNPTGQYVDYGDYGVYTVQPAAIAAKARGGAVNIDVTGDVTATEAEAAVYAENQGGTININVTADVSATGADVNTGVVIGSSPATTEETYSIDKDADPVMINVDDVILHKTVQIGGEWVKIYKSGGKLYALNEDDTTYQPVKEEEVEVYDEGNTNVTITGDVTADDIGVAVELPEVQTANITIDGTVSGQTAGIVLKGDTQLSESVTMTVWEVIPNKDNVIVVRESEGDDGKTVYTQDEEAEKLVQYIIRIKDDSVPYIAMYGTTDFTAGNGEKYKVAYEGDTVLVRLNIPDGKELVGAYWDVDQKGQMLVDPDTGEYYVEVPRGGGVQLSLVMKDIPKPANNNVSYCTLKFFEDKDAAAKNVTVAKGHMYTLPAAPEKEGKTFVGWAESAVDPSDPGWKEPAEGDASILAAGTEYKVTENKSFVGIWK